MDGFIDHPVFGLRVRDLLVRVLLHRFDFRNVLFPGYGGCFSLLQPLLPRSHHTRPKVA